MATVTDSVIHSGVPMVTPTGSTIGLESAKLMVNHWAIHSAVPMVRATDSTTDFDSAQ